MYRAALRSAPRALRTVGRTKVAPGSRRFLTTAPADRKGTWKGSALRWGVAIAAVYWYNTSPIFADELPPRTGLAPPQFSDADLPTVEAVIEEKRRKVDATAQAEAPPPPAATEATSVAVPSLETGSPAALEDEAESQGAFDPETGEINWDCPCLGGMAHGPCGEEFKAAFSCFVYSKEEPKGMDCIDKFQHMQDCFRKYPEIYGAELADDDDEENSPAAAVNPEGDTATPRQGEERESDPPHTADSKESQSAEKVGPLKEAAKADVKSEPPSRDENPADT